VDNAYAFLLLDTGDLRTLSQSGSNDRFLARKSGVRLLPFCCVGMPAAAVTSAKLPSPKLDPLAFLLETVSKFTEVNR